MGQHYPIVSTQEPTIGSLVAATKELETRGERTQYFFSTRTNSSARYITNMDKTMTLLQVWNRMATRTYNRRSCCRSLCYHPTWYKEKV